MMVSEKKRIQMDSAELKIWVEGETQAHLSTFSHKKMQSLSPLMLFLQPFSEDTYILRLSVSK